jgi:hypothetical protein
MPDSRIHKQDQKAGRNLTPISEESGPAPIFQHLYQSSNWPLSSGYRGNEAYEMRAAVPQTVPPVATQEQQPAETHQEEPSKFRVHKRKKDRIRCFAALIVFPIIVFGVIVTVFNIRNGVIERKKQASSGSPNVTGSAMMSNTLISTDVLTTTLISTEFTSPSFLSAATVSEFSTTTVVTTRPMTIVQSTTLIEVTTLVQSTTLVESSAMIESTTQNKPSTLVQSSTSAQVSKLAESSSQVTTFLITAVQSITVTETNTTTTTQSMLPNSILEVNC